MSKVPDLFKRLSNLASLRPAAIQQYVQQHQQAPAQTAEPQLLQRLHACLDEAAIHAALGQPTQSTRRHKARRQLDAYHRVFELLLASLTTYRFVQLEPRCFTASMLSCAQTAGLAK